MTKKNEHAVALGRLGGRVGGKSKSPAKMLQLAAARANRKSEKARAKKKDQ
jgi:hypothetical protein